MTPKLQIKGLAALIDSLDSTPTSVVTKPINDEYKVPLYNVQNREKVLDSRETIQSPYREDYLKDMFLL